MLEKSGAGPRLWGLQRACQWVLPKDRRRLQAERQAGCAWEPGVPSAHAEGMQDGTFWGQLWGSGDGSVPLTRWLCGHCILTVCSDRFLY